MSSLEITPNEFVTKIPLCQANVSWENIVTALDSSPSGIIGIVDFNFCPLGILESHQILEHIAHNSIPPEIIAEVISQSCSKSVVPLQKINLTSLISRITALSSQIKIKDLISLLNNQESLISEKNYFIVDSIGKVQGLLDIAKLLKHMTQGDSNPAPKVDRQSCSSNLEEIHFPGQKTLVTLFEQIPLPLMLQNAEGNICYQNPAWRQQINQHQKTLLTDLKDNAKYATAEGLALQSAIFSQNPNAKKSVISTECYFPIEHDDFHSLFNNSQRQHNINSIPKTFSLREHLQYSTEDFYEQIADNSYLITQNDSGLDCQHIRFPIQLAVQNQEQTYNNQSSQKYWLVLGTQLSLGTNLITDNSTVQQTNNNLDQVRRSSQVPGEIPANVISEVTEAGIRSSSDLNKLGRLQNEFMVNISHDLKSPLTAIIGLSSLLREEKLGSLNSRQIRYLDLIYRGGRQLMGIVTEMLDITSLARGKLRLKLETIDLEQLCHQAYQQVVTKLEAVHEPHKNRPLVLAQFQFNLESDSSLVIADRLRLNQILTRLLENAAKSTSEEGEIGIRIERWADWVAIIVWDTGRGISETFQASLSEEMFEPDNFLTSSEKTTGLGLILAQQLAQSHGGDISFTSQINRGSEFTVILPANPLMMEDREGFFWKEKLTSDRNHHNQSTLVLIVETSSLRIKDLTKNLKKLGYYAVIARNQQEALYKASHLKPTKIILNNELIQLTGQDILTALKSDPQTSHIPVLLTKSEQAPSFYLSLLSREDGILSHVDGTNRDGGVSSTCKNRPRSDDRYSQAEQILLLPLNKINQEVLAKYFPPLTSQNYCPGKRLTMLRLCLTSGEKSLTSSEIDLLFEAPSFNLCHHIIEADSVEQAHMLARIWKIDIIIWDGSNLDSPLELLRSLSTFTTLAQIPIVTLDEKTTAAANQFDNLTVFPCLVPINEKNIAELMQVIQSAAMSNE